VVRLRLGVVGGVVDEKSKDGVERFRGWMEVQ